jgi:hypothetical protein
MPRVPLVAPKEASLNPNKEIERAWRMWLLANALMLALGGLIGIAILLSGCGGPEDGPDLCALRIPLVDQDQADGGTVATDCTR